MHWLGALLIVAVVANSVAATTKDSQEYDDIIANNVDDDIKALFEDDDVAAMDEDVADRTYAEVEDVADNEDAEIEDVPLIVSGMAEKIASDADAKVEDVVSDADANVEDVASDADTKVEDVASDADAKVEEVASDADTKVEEVASDADAKVEEVASDADAKVEDVASDADAIVEEVAGDGDAKVEEVAANDDAKVEEVADNPGAMLEDLDADANNAIAEDVVEEEAHPKIKKRTTNCGSSPSCSPEFEPFPNLHAAMYGYHIMEGNPFTFLGSDKGFKNSFIFMPMIKNAQHRYELHSGVSGSGTMSCSLKENFEQIATVQDYQRKLASHSSEGTELSSNQEVEYEVSKGPASVKGKVPPVVQASFSSSKAYSENEQFFTQTKGILSMKEAVCEVYRLHINLFDLPPFSPAIQNAIYELNAAVAGTKAQQDTIFDRFINEFGTHFVKFAIMGARLSVTTRYTSEEKATLTDDKINECNSESLKISVGASAGYSSKKCNNVGNANSNSIAGKFSRKYITSYGSTVQANMNQWTQQEFKSPLPIKMELSPITNLFQTRYMGSDRLSYKDKPFTPDISGILAFFGPRYWNYCETHKDILFPSGVVKTCNPEKQKGCGWNDNCVRGKQTCINDRSRSTGYKCCTDPCKNNPCRNGGTCRSDMTRCSYTCTCKVSWKGSTCTTRYTNKAHMTTEIRNLLASRGTNEALRTKIYNFLARGYPGNKWSVTVMNGRRQNDNDWRLHCSNCGQVILLTEVHGKNVIVAWGKTNADYSGANSKEIVFSAVHHKGCNTKTSVDRAWNAAKSQGANMILAVRWGNGLRHLSNGGGAFKNFQCGGTHSCNFWGKNCKYHMSSLVVFYGNARTDGGQGITCSHANWWGSFDKQGWSTCDKSTQYIRGFYRTGSGAGKLYNLESANCCTKPSSLSSSARHCTGGNWWASFDKNYSWNRCPTNYFLTGLYRTSGEQLHNLEQGKCCRPSGALHKNCYTQDISKSFDKQGWSQCRENYFVTGLYRGNGNNLYQIEYLSCCQML